MLIHLVSDVYQLGLQAAFRLIASIDHNKICASEIEDVVKLKLHEVLGPVVATGRDFDWISEAILASLCMQ